MKKWLEKLTGIDKIREEANAAKEEALRIAEEAKEEAKTAIKEAKEQTQAAIDEAEEARKAAEFAKLSPKEQATKIGEPWVGVLETHVNKENVRNGFFELDWNELFVDHLVKAGYGTEADNPEDIVDRWFRELCANVVVDGDYAEFLGNVQAGSLDGSAINASKK